MIKPTFKQRLTAMWGILITLMLSIFLNAFALIIFVIVLIPVLCSGTVANMYIKFFITIWNRRNGKKEQSEA